MKDRFEDFISKHREEFDIHEPSPKLWQRIEKELAGEKRIPLRYYLSRAAIFIILIAATFFVQRTWLDSEELGLKTIRQKEAEINIPELKEAEMYYSGIISSKMAEVKPLLADNPALEKELKTDLNDLDSIYLSLKKDLHDNVANQEVLEAMIENYRIRISILEDMLSYLSPENDTIKNSDYEL